MVSKIEDIWPRMDTGATNEAYLITGGNIGDRKRFLTDAKNLIEDRCGTIQKASSFYETAAWGKTDQPSYLNQCLLLHTPLSPQALLQELLAIEEMLGRVRKEKYGARTIDIDILFFNDEVVNQPGLQLPHPQIAHRRFVLECLNELAPGKKHPLLHRTVRQLLADCTDPLAVKKFT
jgi:2-amino-4-hydroxy-6-hydroxymethyldihydropteridine diphosphokinase